MGQNQLEMTLRTLDDDGNGRVDIGEFLNWFRGKGEVVEGGDEETGGIPVGKETPAEQMKEMKRKAKQTPTVLLVVNVVLGVCVCLSGVLGAVGVWKNHIGR